MTRGHAYSSGRQGFVPPLGVAILLLLGAVSLSVALGARGFWSEDEIPPRFGAPDSSGFLDPLTYGSTPPLHGALVWLSEQPIGHADAGVARAPSLVSALLL